MIPKFRGLSIDENSKGEWQYGHLIEDRGRAFIINEVVEANEQYITIGSWCPVNSETIGQSTGLFDKNNKEVFDGDILAVETDEEVLYVKVYWNEQVAMFMFKSKKCHDNVPLAKLNIKMGMASRPIIRNTNMPHKNPMWSIIILRIAINSNISSLSPFLNSNNFFTIEYHKRS